MDHSPESLHIFISTHTQLKDEQGAIDIQKYHKDNIDSEYQISDEDADRIIAKARHHVRFLDGNRTYLPTSRGMNKRVHSFGAKD